MRIFGPVPSRRLGRSLGINNVRPKTCSYSCIYCQLGRTDFLQLQRDKFYEIEEVVKEVEQKLMELEKKGEKIDYLTFVADGEPTLDKNLGKTINALKKFGVKIAVISNASIVSDKQVREELKNADWVSLKCDAVSEKTWEKINRPHGRLDLDKIHQGMKKFSEENNNELVTETMLIDGVNDNKKDLEKNADFIARLNVSKAYISVPTRPPAESYAKMPTPQKINMAVQIYKERNIKTEYLIGYEGNKFSSTGNIKKDMLNITAVHPLKEEAVKELLKKCHADWSQVEALIENNMIVESEYNEAKYYLRNK